MRSPFCDVCNESIRQKAMAPAPQLVDRVVIMWPRYCWQLLVQSLASFGDYRATASHAADPCTHCVMRSSVLPSGASWYTLPHGAPTRLAVDTKDLPTFTCLQWASRCVSAGQVTHIRLQLASGSPWR